MRSLMLSLVFMSLSHPDPGAPLTTDAPWTSSGEDLRNAYFGFSVASAGDVNGDTFDDVIVGAPGSVGRVNDPEIDLVIRRGRAYLFLGTPNGLEPEFAWMTEGRASFPESNYGWQVASAGDVNGDGFDDVLVVEPGQPGGGVHLFLGGPYGPSPVPDWTSPGDTLLFLAAASAGDANGDGFDDVILGEPAAGPSSTGRVWVYHGSPTGPGPIPDWTSQGDAIEQATFGNSVASAGDVNGDGFGDVVIGAEFFDPPGDNPGFNTGKAYVYLGSSTGLSAVAAWTAQFPGTPPAARFGISVDSAGDVNGDGFDDVLVAGSGENTSLPGRAFVYHGSTAGPSSDPAWSVEGGAFSAFGHSVSGAGDVEGDGFDDVLVGDPTFVTNNLQAGRVFLYSGSPYGLSPSETWSSPGETELHSEFGWSVAGAGDVNGDGRADAIVGAPFFSRPEHVNGKAYAFHGSAAEAEQPPDTSLPSPPAAGETGGSDSCGALGLEVLLGVGLLRRAARFRRRRIVASS